jgi:tetratricopeptide (TPR) repeat protein
MQEERDYLVKFTFPQLRKLCERRGVVWGEVDLRWGVTDEAAAEDRVLPICLEEIRRCRPYFIGLLGERYGWVPQGLPPQLLEQEAWLGEQMAERASVTELEILHGVVRNPAMAGHAFFYFRDPAALDRLAPGLRRDDFVSEGAASAAKLQRLKQVIRASGLPVRENYPDARALGELVLADLTQVINTFFPEGSQPDPGSRETRDHEAYARSRAKFYVSRQEYFDRLDAHADGRDDQPLVILGESGGGKSALLANWAARYRQAHADVFALEHYIGATSDSANWAAMLRRLMTECKRRLDIPLDVPDGPAAVRGEFPNWLHMAAARGRVVLVLDALDQLEDRDGALDLVWLPPVMPENVRLIVSTQPGRPLDEIRKRGWPAMAVKPLEPDERRQLIVEYLAHHSKVLSGELLERIAGAPQAANPLYLCALLAELCVYGDHFTLRQRVEHYLAAATAGDLYGRILERWEQDYERERPGLVREAMSLLLAARRGLAETELLELLRRKGEDRLPHRLWSPLSLTAESSLLVRSGLIGFSHHHFRAAVRSRYAAGPQNQEQAHVRLADYFESRELGPRKADELPWQLLHARKWIRLVGVLRDLPLLDAMSYYDGAFYWQEVEGHSGFKAISTYQFVLEHPETYSGHVESVSFQLAHRGYALQGADLLKCRADEYRKAGNWHALAHILGNLGAVLSVTSRLDEAVEACREHERIAREIGDAGGQVWSLSTLGLILQRTQQYVAAIQHLEHAVQIARAQGANHSLGNTLVNLGAVYYAVAGLWMSPEMRGVRAANENAIRELSGSQDSRSVVEGLLDQAMALYREVETLSVQAGDMVALYRVCINEADVLLRQGQWPEAQEKAERADRICRELGSELGLVRSLDREAEILHSRGEHARALACLQEQEQTCRVHRSLPRQMLQACLANQGNVLQAIGKLDEAIAKFREQARICREEGMQAPPCRDWQPVD